MMVCYEDQSLHQHEHTHIDNDIRIIMEHEIVRYKIFGITYYDGSHYIQKVRLHNGDTLLYDGMEAEGRAQHD